MNNKTENLLNKINIDYLYEFYLGEIEDIEITREDLSKILSIIYNELIPIITEEEFKIICNNYITLITADAHFNQEKIDIKWCIDHLWYLCFGSNLNKLLIDKVKKHISSLQKKLIKEFSIKEKQKEKIKRKIKTNILIN